MKTYPTLVLLLFLLPGCHSSAKRQTTPPLPAVEVDYPALRAVVYTFEYPGYLEAEQTVTLVARVPGYLESHDFIPGQRVHEGQTLFVIEPQPYADRVTQAKAAVESSQSRLAYANASYQRMKEAVKNNAVSEIDYLQAQSTHETARASLETAQSQLRLANTDYSYCHVKAPFTGRVSRNLVDAGNLVGTGTNNTNLATLYKDNRMFLYFNMAYADFLQLPRQSPGAIPVTIRDVNKPKKSWIASLTYMAPNVDLPTGTINLRATALNPNGELLSGMYVKVVIPYKHVPQAIVIPESSIGTNQGGRYVYLVTGDSIVTLRQIDVGTLTPDGMREITRGLTPGERYVTRALVNVRPGMHVRPVTR